MGAAQSADEPPSRSKKTSRGVELSEAQESRDSEADDSRSESVGSQVSEDRGDDGFAQSSGVWSLPVVSDIAHTVHNASPLMLHGSPSGAKGVVCVSTPEGGWSSFTAKEARGRAHEALKAEVEYLLKCVAWESDHGRTCMNIYCANPERCELLAIALRERMFTVINPVRNWYALKARQLLEKRGRVPMPVFPAGVDAEELLLRLLYADPAKAEAQFGAHVGTFKVFVHVSLDAQTESGHSYYFGADHQNYQFHCRDSRLLLKVSW
mmetsp:Transcript_4608/g.13083  ORF Transcript_4608/g.13083 Transcript_4608/m.13083 type:complete len:266 (+) Transcript_4608:131-928(+)